MNDIIRPYTDIFVRYLLGDENNKDLLLCFINAINENYQLPFLKTVTIKNPFNLKNYKNEKESIIDVKATDEQGRQYDIEVQIAGNETFVFRSLYYWAKLYTSQLSGGDKYQTLRPTICINLINFEMIANQKNVHSCFLLTEKYNSELILTDHLILHYLELPKFLKDKDFKTQFEKWMAFFKYEGQREAIMETIIKDDPILTKAHDKYHQFTQNDELLEMYEARMKWQLQYNTDIAYAEEKGIEKGIEQGIEQGIEKGKLENAKVMLRDGLSIEKIEQYTGLSRSHILSLSQDT